MSWLDDVIIDGLSTLLVLRLKDAPAMDTIEVLASVWVAVFRRQPIDWVESLDAPRIQAAFLTVAGNTETFPAPKTVLQHLPSRPERLKIAQDKAVMPDNIKQLWREKLAEPAMTAEQKQRALEHHYALINNIGR